MMDMLRRIDLDLEEPLFKHIKLKKRHDMEPLSATNDHLDLAKLSRGAQQNITFVSMSNISDCMHILYFIIP